MAPKSSTRGLDSSASRKRCVDCRRELTRREFSNWSWRSEARRCLQCASSSTAHPRLQQLLRENQAGALEAAMEQEAGLVEQDRLAVRAVWEAVMDESGALQLEALLSAVVPKLMALTSDKQKRGAYRRVWSAAGQTLQELLRPEKCAARKTPKPSSQPAAGVEWPDTGVRGYWVTGRSSGGKSHGARDEILAELAPLASRLGLVCRPLDGLWKRLVFVMVTPEQPGAPEPDLNLLLGQLLSGSCFRYCETITPFQWVGKAAAPPSASDLQPYLVDLLGSQLAGSTFAIEYKSHNSGSSQSRTHWISHFADLIPPPHSVNLESPAVIIQLRLFTVSGEPFIGFCARPKSEMHSCARDTAEYHERGSVGAAYYRAGVNLSTTSPGSEPAVSAAPQVDQAVARYEARLNQALARADLWHRPVSSIQPSHRPSIQPSIQPSSGNHKRRRRAGHAEAQVAALTRHALPLLSRGGCWTVEFGAGKGSLSKRIRSGCCEAGVQLGGCVLVDRDRERHGQQSRDPAASSAWTDADGSLRLRVDISNLWLGGLAQLRGQQVVAVGKHVCGGATDLALRCLVLSGQLEAAPAEACDADGSERVSPTGVAIALCCYHLCSWDTYVNQSWVLEHGLSAADFGQLVKICSWCHITETDEPAGRAKVRLALLCKRFIDCGRALYLQQHGFDVELVPFVDASITKENLCLLARPRSC